MTITHLRQQAEDIRKGIYERGASGERVNFHTAVTMLSREVCAIAWQPGYREEALSILAELQCSRSADQNA